jgi:hypothetical protein
LHEIEQEEKEQLKKGKQGVHSKGKGGSHAQTKQNDKVFAPQIVQQKPLFQNT